MIEFAVFLYGLSAGLVLMIAQRAQREARPIPAVVNAMGWGLISMSSMLAILLFAVALAMAVGVGGPLVQSLAGM
ncbi:hypothetical protein [Sphingomonas sp. IW22]|uniref:hypothetical protein n=1 Tax=Sphingomonas sp. IW22 TaxID=3242489 RepID=UPI0035213BC7